MICNIVLRNYIMATTLTKNAVFLPTATLTSTSVYAFYASGGFAMRRDFDSVRLAEQTALSTYDATTAIQVNINASDLNAKLGTYRDAEDNFSDADSLVISHTDFKSYLTSASQVISVGKFEKLYSDFEDYVNEYFGWSGGFSSLFTNADTFTITSGVVGGSDNATKRDLSTEGFYNLMKTPTTMTAAGAQIFDMSGSITVANVSKVLRFAVDSNVFNNRTPGDASTDVANADTSLPDRNTHNYGVGDGFRAGDLIFITTGAAVKLKLCIDAELYNPTNNVGSTMASAITATQRSDYVGTNFTETTNASATLIERTLTAPILIRVI
jgi:hypothetical protein